MKIKKRKLNNMLSTTTLSELWPMILAVTFIIIWSVRLEAKNMSCEKENIRIDKELCDLKHKIENEHSKIDVKFESVAIALTGIKESLARIEGRLSNKNEITK